MPDSSAGQVAPPIPVWAGELRDLPRIRESFDAEFYARAYFDSQPPSGLDLFAHYVANVRSRLLDPSLQFSENFYLTSNPDVAQGVHDGRFYCGFHHYVLCGRHESRSPRVPQSVRPSASTTSISGRSLPDRDRLPLPPLDQATVFDPAATMPFPLDAARFSGPFETSDLYPAGPSSLSDEDCEPVSKGDFAPTTLHGDVRLLKSSGLFDADWYRITYSLSGMTDTELAVDFYEGGYRDGRWPNSYFDPLWYLNANVDVAIAGVHPLIHYIVQGDREGRAPILYFDATWYRSQYMDGLNDELALGHFLDRRNSYTASPTPLFDPLYYRTQYSDIGAIAIDVFQHYLHTGFKEGRNPSPDFDTTFYITRNLRNSRENNPLVHYMSSGRHAGMRTKADEDDPSPSRELRKFAKPSPQFEEFEPHPAAKSSDVKILAYYLPQFHAFAENDSWWGAGFTEWTNIARGTPRFVGHYQPRIPRDLGFYDLTDPQTMKRQIELARRAGIYGFCFYHYWFNGKRLMEAPVERYLNDSTLDLPFCLMWANENWTRRWDGAESEVLIAQDYAAEDDEALIDDLARHMADSRYIRLQGRPVLMIYRPGIIPNASDVIERWRAAFKHRHSEDPVIIMAQGFGDHNPTPYGLDGAIEFPPHKVVNGAKLINAELTYLDYDFRGQAYDYDEVAAVSLAEPAPNFPLIKTVVPSWDNDARRQGTGLVITGSTPERYEAWLRGAISYARKNPVFGEKIVCVNAWNEWCEGAYLEPDLHFGSAYLNATSRALAEPTALKRAKVLLVGHDAFPSGAQHLLLYLGKMFRDRFGVQIAYLLLGDGKMVDSYRQLGRVDIVKFVSDARPVLNARLEEGYRSAVINTTASAHAAPEISKAGLSTVLLVHEAPRIMEQKGLVSGARLAVDCVDILVFGSRYLADRFDESVGLRAAKKTIIQPQGLYNPVSPDARSRTRIRETLGIGENDLVVLNVGYADLRKGFDTFVQMSRYAFKERNDVHFLWVGNVDPELEAWLRKDLDAATLSGTFHHVPFTSAIADYFSACDVFALTSREDPYPSVVLEAISADKPVVVFAEAGGIPEIVTPAIGRIVPYGDAPAMLAAAIELASQAPDSQRSAVRADLIQTRFDFASYGWKLLGLLGVTGPSISVIVPNYNYSRYLPERLGTVFNQAAPIFELVVLDDASPDDSLSVLEKIRGETGREFRLVANEINSGSVFQQWRVGLSEAQGELVWIAEADDISDPTFLARLSATFADPDVAFAFSDSEAIDPDGVQIWPSYKGYYESIAPGLLSRDAVFSAREFLATHLAVKNLILNVSSVVWRKSALVAAMDAAAGDLAEFKMAGDWLIYAHACLSPGAKVAYIADPLNRHRRHPSSVTHALKAETHLAEIEHMHRLIEQGLGRSGQPTTAQKAYVKEVTVQFGLDQGPEHARP